jgi:hypothetical protein
MKMCGQLQCTSVPSLPFHQLEVVSVMLQLLYPLEKNPSFQLDNGLGGEERNL